MTQLPVGYSTYTEADGEVRADEERTRRLEEGEEGAILAILAGKKPQGKQRPLRLPYRNSLVLVFELALETAMRLREIYTLTADQVDLQRRTIFLFKTKNGDTRQVPLSSRALTGIK